MQRCVLIIACAHGAAGLSLFRGFFAPYDGATASEWIRVFDNASNLYQQRFPVAVDTVTGELVVTSSITALAGDTSRDDLRNWQMLGLYPWRLAVPGGGDA